jgi:hypothetical protein
MIHRSRLPRTPHLPVRAFDVRGELFAVHQWRSIHKAVAQVLVIVGHRRVDRNGSPDQLDPRVQLTRLESDHAQQMQRIGVIRLAGEQLAANAFGLGKSSGLVLLEGQCIA